ncbi:MAG: diguanylate cyclase, partial [Eubacteriales bacterium]|nr:diguanylate cyclase [Eubacteriales bacterium]
MAVSKNVLVVDDANRFDGQTLFEPEYQVHRVVDRQAAMAFLQSQNPITVTLINLEASSSEGLALLTEIREQKGLDAMVVWICLDADDAYGIERSFEAGADEMICRLPGNTALQYQIRRLKAFPIRYEGRDTPVFLAGVSDVPSRYRVEAVLRESDRKMAAIMNAIPGGIAMFDLHQPVKLLYSNPALSRMCGYSVNENRKLFAEDYHKLLDSRDHVQVDRLISDFRENPQPVKAVFRLLTKTGSFRWVRISATPTGENLQCSVVFIDITQDKENEIKSERMRCELYYRSEHDALTGINNRETFYRKTAEMLHANPGTDYVLVTMDIDRFKVVNDMFGKEVGDQILVVIAEGLRSLLSDVGTCARMEADHFVACLPQKMLDMERIMSLFNASLKRQKIDYQIQLSYGIYQINDIDTPVNHMCDRAVMAMRTVKGNAVHRYAFYDDKLRQAMLEEDAVLAEMNSALEQGQFVPYLQPIFSIDSDQPVSVEMLV